MDGTFTRESGPVNKSRFGLSQQPSAALKIGKVHSGNSGILPLERKMQEAEGNSAQERLIVRYSICG